MFHVEHNVGARKSTNFIKIYVFHVGEFRLMEATAACVWNGDIFRKLFRRHFHNISLPNFTPSIC